MLSTLWISSTAIRGYLRSYMPTNIAIDQIRARGRRWWAIPTTALVVPIYACAASYVGVIVERGGPGYLNVIVILFFWNAMKFAALAVLSPVATAFRLLRNGHVHGR